MEEGKGGGNGATENVRKDKVFHIQHQGILVEGDG
jgi:hypothetical protein